MSLVIVEREFPEPELFEAIDAKGDKAAWCYQLYGIRYDGGYFAADSRSMICTYEAPDAESVRAVQRRFDMPVSRVWSATFHQATDLAAADADAVATTDVVVERSFESAIDIDALQSREHAGQWCLDLHRVRFGHTYLALDCKRMLCLYRAPDAESVRTAQRQLDMPVDRVWSAQRQEPVPC